MTANEGWSTQPETFGLRRLQTAMEQAEVALAHRMHLGPTDLSAMAHLAFADQPLGPGRLGSRLGLTASAATELVDRLERAGHVERQRDTVDRRRVHLVPTASAMAEVGEELRPLLTALDEAITRFTADDRRVIERFLREMVAVYAAFAEQR